MADGGGTRDGRRNGADRDAEVDEKWDRRTDGEDRRRREVTSVINNGAMARTGVTSKATPPGSGLSCTSSSPAVCVSAGWINKET